MKLEMRRCSTAFTAAIGLMLLGMAAPAAHAATPAPIEYPPVLFTIKWLDYTGDFQAVVENMTPYRQANALVWVPPLGLRITAITSSKGGDCTLADDGSVLCSGKLAAPTCVRGTCYPSAGSSITLTFTAVLTGIPPGSTFEDLSMVGTSLTITSMSPAPSPAPLPDMPLCAKGHSSTKAKPCVKK